MASFLTIDDLDVAGRRVLVRLDLNVPMKDGRVTDATRIERAVETLQALTARGARVVVLSHYGRPRGRRDPALSLAPVAPALAAALGRRSIPFVPDCAGPVAEDAVAAMGDGDVVLLENLRFEAGEEANDPAFAAALARLGDIYVDDAFSCAHRAHASTVGVAERLPAVAGRAMQAELDALESALNDPDRPLAALVGGAKVSTKLDVLLHLVEKVDRLIIGGGMANTFLYALGTAVGASLCEHALAPRVREIMARADAAGCRVLLPSDVVIARELAPGVETRTVPVAAVPDDWRILDIGPASAEALAAELAGCRTIVWNGPLGAFETPPFDAGTVAVARAAARLTQEGRLRSVAGGGDTVAALSHAGVTNDFSYVSTAGGAFLEWLEGRELPGVAVLRRPAGNRAGASS